MRPSFGGGGGRGMGGGGGGGNMLRAVGRAVTRTGVGIQEPFPASANAANSATAASGSPTSPRTPSGHGRKLSSKNQLSLSSASSHFGAPVPAASSAWPQYDDYEWVSADGSEDERRSVSYEDFLWGTVPSTDEVHSAVSAIQQVFDSTTYPQLIRDRFVPYSDLDKDITASGGVSPTGSDSDWIEPTFQLSNSRTLQPYGPDVVLDTFHILRNDPSVQRMVVSLSTDRAVWEAVMNNQAVRELTESCCSAESSTLSDATSEESNKEVNSLVDIVRQLFLHTKANITDVVEKLAKLMSDLFSPPLPPAPANEEEVNTTAGTCEPFEGKLRASFMLSMVVLLIVVVSRARVA